MFTFPCFPETSLLNVPVIRLLSTYLTKTLKQPLNERVVWKQMSYIYLLLYVIVEVQTQVHLINRRRDNIDLYSGLSKISLLLPEK